MIGVGGVFSNSSTHRKLNQLEVQKLQLTSEPGAEGSHGVLTWLEVRSFDVDRFLGETLQQP